MELTGKILFIDPAVTPTPSNPSFQTRIFAIEVISEVNFQTSVHHYAFQTVKPSTLDGIGIGDKVTVTFGLRCSRFVRKAPAQPTVQNPDNLAVMVSLDCAKLEVIERSKAHVSTTASAAAETSENKPQPEGEVPLDKEGKKMIWDGQRWVEDAPF